MLHCLAKNPMRCVDWRWQRAVGIVAGRQPEARRSLDTAEGASWIRKACTLKRWLDQCRDEYDQAIVASRLSDLFFAYMLWEQKDHWRWYVEAYVLAGSTNEEIGAKLDMDPAIIRAYEALFFNVRDRLANQGYILNAVLGPAIQRGLSEREYDLLLKLYGYLYGPYMLDALYCRTVNPTRCTSPESVAAALRDDAIGSVMLDAAQAGKTLRVNSHTQLELLHIFTKFVEIERTTDASDNMQEQLLTRIGDVLRNVSFSVGGRDPLQGHVQIELGDTDTYRQAGIELTTMESLRVAAGERLPHLDPLLEVSFPDPPRQEPVRTG